MRKICAKIASKNLREQKRDVQLSADYSPDLASCKFFLFQKVKPAVKGHHFGSKEEIKRSVTQALNDTPQNAFQECYKQWQHH